MTLPELKITVFSDYICPFCYVGHHRLSRLRDTYDLKINWCFLEIHPEVPAEGAALNSLDYSTEQWQQMMQNLRRIAGEEHIPLADIGFITNSRDALLLSEATKQHGRDTFYHLHEKLFSAYFAAQKNIADRQVLIEIAESCGIERAFVESAWQDDGHQQRLTDNYDLARTHNIQSVPSFLFGERQLTGVVTEATFREAAAQLADS